MADFDPGLTETRIAPFALIRRERRLPVRGEVSATIGSRLDPLDVIGRAAPPRLRRALSLTRVLGVREAEVPRRLVKQAGDLVEPREIIIAKPINFGLQQLVYRAPGAGQIVAIKGSWMVLDLAGSTFDLKALYRGTVLTVTPRLGAVVEAQGALVQGIWGSGKEGYGVLKMVAQAPDQLLEPENIEMDARNTVMVGGLGTTEEALRRAQELEAQGLVLGSLEPRLRELAEHLELPVVITEGFGRIPMSRPSFELLSSFNGQEAAVTGLAGPRGAVRPEIFIPLANRRPPEAAPGPELAPSGVRAGAAVRLTSEPYLGRTGRLESLTVRWTGDQGGEQLPSVEVELVDGSESERLVVPWTNLELVG